MTQLAFDFEVDVAEWVPVVNALITCRDCGRRKFTWERGCAGAGNPEGLWVLCDDCAALDGVGTRRDPAEADVSRWGLRTTAEERERLAKVQATRRAKYLAERAA
jgi:hypothetical protein